jgi:GMP synthase (glutamine-hydrolysing)
VPLTALAIRHLGFEDLGIITAQLTERGYDVEYRDAGIDVLAPARVAAADLVVVLGGPIGAFDEDRYPFLVDELAALGARLETGRPTLGICLGAQLLARALGAEVTALGRVEIGYQALTLTAEGKASPLRHLDGVPVLHWHGDQFAVPAGGSRLASTAVTANQAYALGRTVLGLQFHLETPPGEIERWLIGHAGELLANGIHPQSIRDGAQQAGDVLPAAAARVVGEWLDALSAGPAG